MIKWYFLENLFSAACSSSHLSFRVSIKKTIKPNSFHFKLLNNLFHELGIGISLSIRLNPVISNIPNMSENLTLPSLSLLLYEYLVFKQNKNPWTQWLFKVNSFITGGTSSSFRVLDAGQLM